MKNILCYCEANNRTGYGHFSRIQELIKLIKKEYKRCKFYIYSKIKLKLKFILKIA